MGNIVIGKHTLESLTSGMYADPYVVFREYIQNSVDSVDEAVRVGVLLRGAEQIVVKLVPTEQQIVISDNGLGIPSAEAEKTLISIGNSQKSSENSRGFRGIGRLSALSYCKRLTFTTSFKGENVATQVTIDAAKLAEFLLDNSVSDVTVMDVLASVYSVSYTAENENKHYFVVQLDGVESNSKLLSCSDVEDYLEQNAPVPYHPDFVWGKEIVNRLKNVGVQISTYNILLEYGARMFPIYKSYRDEFVIDKNKNIFDVVRDICIIKIPQNSNMPSAIGWLAKTNYQGTIYDKAIRGIRLRKGNILIGDHQTLNVAFKDARFNGWSAGEIFVLDKLLIPNARRDNFEKNTAYFSLFEQLTTVAAEITKEIRNASMKRNVSLSKAMKQLQETERQVLSAIDDGVAGSQKGLMAKKLKQVQTAVFDCTANDDSSQYYQDMLFAELDMLMGKLNGATKYKALNTINTLTNTEKRILERVIGVLETLHIDNVDNIIDSILTEFVIK